ncbi:MAG: hypothetical protein ACRC62_08080 [Microcoleus sp.]
MKNSKQVAKLVSSHEKTGDRDRSIKADVIKKVGGNPMLLARLYSSPCGVEGYGCPSGEDMVVLELPYGVKLASQKFRVGTIQIALSYPS